MITTLISITGLYLLSCVMIAFVYEGMDDT